MNDYTMFQSTHPRGVRQAVQKGFDVFMVVSIHAPTRGATATTEELVQSLKFQSTHPRGVRLALRSEIRDYVKFQSTHPRGVRL